MACSTSAGSTGLLKGFAGLLTVGTVVSVATGTTYFRRVIRRDEEPAAFWASVISMGMLAVFVWGMLWFCPES
jgi:hypothetical protein